MTDYRELMTEKEIEAATGYKSPAKQIKALRAARIHFVPKPDGKPSLTWYSFNHPMPVVQNDRYKLEGFNLDAI